MDAAAGMEGEVAVTVSGVAPVTLIAQISVALIAVAVTAVYILKHLPDPGENSEPSSHRKAVSQGDAPRIARSEENADNTDDGGASTSWGSGADSGWASAPSTSLEEYRAIISHDEYKDLCSSAPEEKPRPARRKSSLSSQSKEWPTSLESIDEEDEEEDDLKTEGGKIVEDKPSPKQSPKRGSRVPSWYFSKSSSGIPSLPKDRDLDAQFDQLATKSPVGDQCTSKDIDYEFEDVSYVDDARKIAITGFSGPPIGFVRRKPWPLNQYERPSSDYEYASTEQTSNQSRAMDSDHAKVARMNFMLKGRVNSFSSDNEKGLSIPDIQIYEPTTNEFSSSNEMPHYGYLNQGSDGVDSGDVSESSQWVETLASSIVLPEKYQDEVRAEIVQVDLDEDAERGSDLPREESGCTTKPKPIPRPRTSITGVSKKIQGASDIPSTSESAPPLLKNTPTDDSSGIGRPSSDIDRPLARERAPNTGAGQPLTNANEGLHQQTKHTPLGDIKSDAALQHGIQTKQGFIKKENIDLADSDYNSSPPVARHDDKTNPTIAPPDARVFTVVGSSPGPIGSFHRESDSNAEVTEEVNINSTPDSDTIVISQDNEGTPGGNVTNVVTSRSPYETGTLSLSTRLPCDESGLQRVNSAEIISGPTENTPTDHSLEEHDISCVAVETVNAGNEILKTGSEALHNTSDSPNTNDALESGYDVNSDFSRNGKIENENADLDEIRATLIDTLPLKRPKELLLNGTSERQNSKPFDRSRISNGVGVSPHDVPSDSEHSSLTSPGDVIAQQRARIQRSLEKLNVPDWYKKSSHYKRAANSQQIDQPDYQSEPEPRMTRSPSSCLSDCWSVTSSEEATSLPPVSTKLAFQSEARYRRDFPKKLFYEPIRNAFSCAELPTQSSKGVVESDPLNYTSVIDDTEISHSTDDTLHGKQLNQTSSSLKDINSDSPPTQSSPSHGLRVRSKSEGDGLDDITYFDSLAVKRLERHMYDSVFFVTGYVHDSQGENLDDGQSDSNSLFASGSLPDESFDEMEYRRQMYDMRESRTRDPTLIESQQRPTFSYNNNLPNEDDYTNRVMDTFNVSNDHELENKPHPTTMGNSSTATPLTTGVYDTQYGNQSMESRSQWYPTPSPRRNFAESPTLQGLSPLADAHQSEELEPDPRYNPDGSRNAKISPRFAMVTPQSGRERESPRSSPGSNTPRKTTVKIMVTDTSLEDSDSGPSTGHRSEQDPMSATSSDQETVVDGTTNTWTPLDLDKLKDSEFSGVLSVITSRHMKPGNRSGLYLPGSGFIPPKEVTMEEIVDSLLGLPYQRATSVVDLNSSGYRGSSSTSTPLTCSTPDLSSSWSPSRGSTPVSSSDKSHSADSLYSEDGNVLNSIVVGRRRIEEGGYHSSNEEDGGDLVGDEIIMVKCSYKKCAKTRELAEARKSFKTCHNCYTYYCSRQCRKLHWPRHKKRCLFSRVNSACKHVIYHSRYNGQLQSDLTRVARTGYLSRGRGAILLIFPDTESAENYTEKGFDALPSAPTYSTVCELENSDLFGDHMKYLLEMCRTYDPERKFVLNVAIMASGEQHRGNRPRRTDMAVKKCAKLSLIPPHTDPSSKEPDPVPDTLIITSPSGPHGDGALDRKARQVCFVHIQRQLRQRGVNLRHQHGEIYDKLCRWVEDHEHFTPTTIYPLDERTGKRFMCVLMPESEPDDLGWINNPELLEDIDLDAELEKLENVAGLVVTDL